MNGEYLLYVLLAFEKGHVGTCYVRQWFAVSRHVLRVLFLVNWQW